MRADRTIELLELLKLSEAANDGALVGRTIVEADDGRADDVAKEQKPDGQMKKTGIPIFRPSSTAQKDQLQVQHYEA